MTWNSGPTGLFCPRTAIGVAIETRMQITNDRPWSQVICPLLAGIIGRDASLYASPVLVDAPAEQDRAEQQRPPQPDRRPVRQPAQHVGPEHLIAHQVGPGRRRPAQAGGVPVDAVARDRERGERLDDLRLHVLDQPLERRDRGARELGQWIAAVECHQMDFVAQRLEVGQILAPGAVEREQRQPALDLVEQRRRRRRRRAPPSAPASCGAAGRGRSSRRARLDARRRCSVAGPRASRRSGRAGAGRRSSHRRRSAALAPPRAAPARSRAAYRRRRRRLRAAGAAPAGRCRSAAADRRRARRRSASGRGRPAGRRGRAAGRRCARSRGGGCRSRRGRRAPAPRSRSASSVPPSLMSVPRPAMLVEMVTAPSAPASATIAASALVVLRVEHLVRDPARRSSAASRSESATLAVPTSTGRPVWLAARISASSAASRASRRA